MLYNNYIIVISNGLLSLTFFQVYFWGQLDVPREEKAKRKQSCITILATPTDKLQLQVKQENDSPPAEYKVEVKGDTGIAADHHLAVVGRPFEVEILQRNGNAGSSSHMVRSMNG